MEFSEAIRSYEGWLKTKDTPANAAFFIGIKQHDFEIII